MDDTTTMWTAVGAIAQGVASILAMIALIYSMTTFKRSLSLSHYTEMDKMYFDLLKLRLEEPGLTQPGNPKYDAYAFMVWNFLETIYDHCGTDEYLCSTWHPILKTEGLLHRDWFYRPGNEKKFKEQFRWFVQDSIPKS